SGEKINGRKRHLVTDTLGLIWALVLTPASVQNAEGAKQALTEFRQQVKSPKRIWVDAAYRAVVSWAWSCWAWTLEVVSAPKGQKRLCRPRQALDRGTDLWLVESLATPRQRLRTHDGEFQCFCTTGDDSSNDPPIEENDRFLDTL